MPDMSESAKSEWPDIHFLIGIVRRRHLPFLLCLFAGWFLVWGLSWVLSPRYKSTTTILVEQPTMPQNYVLPNINDDLQTRMQSMTEQILSRTRLLAVIQKLHLYEGKSGISDDEKVEAMRKNIDIELVRDPSRREISAFSISYSARDPRLAQQVTAELEGLFITDNLKTRQQMSVGTTNFMEQQLEEASKSLSAQEAKVKEFEGQHEGALPTQEASNLQILAGFQSQLQNEQDALNTAKQQRVYLEALLQQERAAQARVRPGSDGLQAPTDLATIDAQLDKLRTQLAELSSRYTDSYPDVQSLKDQIAKTEAMRARLIAQPKLKGAGSNQPGNDAATGSGADMTLSATGRQVQGQLQANEVEISNRERSIESLKAKIGEYQGRLNLEPATEQQLDDLTRGYEQSRANYDDLLKKKDESEMATSMEEMQQGERFTMLDPPSLPSQPDFPNRLKFCKFGLGAGLFLGLVVAGALEFFDDRMHNGKEIKALLPMPVISEVPNVVTASDRRSAKKRIALGWSAAAFVVVAIVAGSLVSLFYS